MTTTENVFTVVPADWVPGPQQGFWTYEDYARLPDEGKHFEVVIGIFSGQAKLPSRVARDLPVSVEQFFP